MIVDCDAQGNKSLQSVIRIGHSRNVMNMVPLTPSIPSTDGEEEAVYLRVSSDGQFYYLSYSLDNEEFKPMGKMEYRYLSTETIGGFTEVHLGVYTHSLSEQPEGWVDLDWFEYKDL